MNDKVFSVRGGYGIATGLTAREAIDEMKRLAAIGANSRIFDRQGRTICDNAAARVEAFR